ncbi:Glycerophosphoryl diester phosphodiesterase family [Verrucomicrobiia bacterium DG1235]|nr:Glycerophosphoryl diester phosphodiesterase family [Verrucomicrobiae bacterium DG1235]
MPPKSILLAATIAVLHPLMTATPTSHLVPKTQNPEPNPPLIVAHRGASADAPENTLPAFQLAWQQGADAIEGDFHLTRDRQIVCIHDDNTSAYSHKKLTVRKTKLADLQALDLLFPKFTTHSSPLTPYKIPTLAEVLATVPAGKKLYIEIKSSARIVRHLFATIDASGIDPDQLVIIAFSARVIKKIKSQRPSLKAMWLTDIRHRSKGAPLEPTPDQILHTLRRTGADGVSVYAHPHVDSAYFQPIHHAGYQLHVWTVDTPAEAQRWTDLGALSLTTNQPALLLQALKKTNKHQNKTK